MPIRKYWSLSLGVGCLLLCPAIEAPAYPDAYPPFSSENSVPRPTLRANPVINYGGRSEFQQDRIRIAVGDLVNGCASTRVWLDGKQVLNTCEAHPNVPLPVGARVFYTDLTGDGRRDLLIYSSPVGNGLAASIEIADLLIAQPDGAFRHVSFETYAAGPEDFIDVNGDGRYEMLWANYYFEGGHSYWVYRVAEITTEGLQLRDDLIPGFPKIIWFTEKPNDKLTQQLTAAEREDLIHQSTTKWQESVR